MKAEKAVTVIPGNADDDFAGLQVTQHWPGASVFIEQTDEVGGKPTLLTIHISPIQAKALHALLGGMKL